MKRKMNIIAILGILFGIIIDQYTKYLAQAHLPNAPISIIENVFELRYLENRGAAFGMMQNQQTLFVMFCVIFLVIGSIAYMKMPYTKRMLPMRVCMILIATGAIGNMIDRIRLQYVIDFFYFKLIDFPIFNVADIFVTVAAFLVGFLILFYYQEEEIDEMFGKSSKSTDRS